MVTITLQLDDETARQLKTRALRAGITVEDIAAQDLSRGTQDPFEFVGIGEAEVCALDTDQLLAMGFGSK
jgi:plasmid stability protein